MLRPDLAEQRQYERLTASMLAAPPDPLAAPKLTARDVMIRVGGELVEEARVEKETRDKFAQEVWDGV